MAIVCYDDADYDVDDDDVTDVESRVELGSIRKRGRGTRHHW